MSRNKIKPLSRSEKMKRKRESKKQHKKTPSDARTTEQQTIPEKISDVNQPQETSCVDTTVSEPPAAKPKVTEGEKAVGSKPLVEESDSSDEVDDDVEGSDIKPVVVSGSSSTFDEGYDSGMDSLGDLNGSEIKPVVVTKEPNPEPAAPAGEKKERKTSTAGCVGGVFTSEGVRGYQEDRYGLDNDYAIYAVYDGHGGDKASRYLAKHMKDYLLDELDMVPDGASDDKVENALKQAFIKLDDKFLEKRVDDGSTACLGYIMHDGKNGKLYVANAGDTRAIVVCADNSVVEMSKDHKPDSPEEKKRIEAAYHEVNVICDVYQGKRIKIARVDGMLAVARAIGDGSLKDMTDPAKCAVTCVPEVRTLPLDPAKHRFLVIACDGIWDVYSNQEVADIVTEKLGDKKKPFNAEDLDYTAQFIVNAAIEKGSMDNCTVVIVAL